MMKRLSALATIAALAALTPSAASAQTAPTGWDNPTVWTQLWTYSGCGGNNFATCMSVDVRLTSGNTLGVFVNHYGNRGTFTRVGIVNVPGADESLVSQGYSSGPNGAWRWNKDSGLSGGGLPNYVWAWQAPPSPMQNGIAPNESGYYTFVLDNSIDPRTLGVAVHAQGYYGCSTKFGVWDQGATTNDAGAGNYDPNCVGVPEPGSMALLATGLAGLLFVGRRRRDDLELEDDDTDM